MKNQEFYNRHKTRYTSIVDPVFSKKNWWRIVLIITAAVLIGPLVIYKNQSSTPFSFGYYLQVTKYFLFIGVPFGGLLFWANWRESLKHSRGYCWVGKFEVVSKRSLFPFCYLLLAPGINNKLKVDRALFEKTRIGDFISIRRDALGNIDEVSRLNFSSRLSSFGAKRVSKSPKNILPNDLSQHGQSIPS